MNKIASKVETLELDLAGEPIEHSLIKHLTYTIGKDHHTATDRDWFHTVAHAVRDRLIERWMNTMRSYYREDSKRVYYLSLEFLIGRTLNNSLLNLRFDEQLRGTLMDLGLNFADIHDIEEDAALGNGGLGRLAACFLDSMATLGLPGYGYGIRYEYGIFNQRIENGYQVEHPENWLRYGNPWEFPRPEVLHTVKFYGRVVEYADDHGQPHRHWVDTQEVMAMAYDTPIPGYDNKTVNNMRLWSAKASRDFDLDIFNRGDYIEAVADKNSSENISRVLYPNDSTISGKELRLKQQYFFVSASLQDILYRYRKDHDCWDELPNKVAIQLNDTHPSIAIAELMRMLVDEHCQDWEYSWELTRKTFSYTNHTLLPEALEAWPTETFENLLPRHMQIIYEINYRFLRDVMHAHPGDNDLLARMSIIDEKSTKRVRMSHLAIVGSHKVNGVSELHSQLMQESIFNDFHAFYPDKFINITNGITPRRWLRLANPNLSALISQHIGDEWVTNLSQLSEIAPLANNREFRKSFREIKRKNKQKLADYVLRTQGITINLDGMCDVQIKRIHEYKRQLLNVLHIVTLYNRLRDDPESNIVPRTILFSGKAAPAYAMAKLTIKLINDIADIVNHDPLIGDRLKVVFIPNYNVTKATNIVPAADLSEQISTAGMEASGTGNMKLALNGALTIGTLDGANVEIKQQVGEENIFIFGMNSSEVTVLKQNGYRPADCYETNPELRRAIDMISNGFFCTENCARFRPITDALLNHDPFFVMADYASYIAAQEQVDQAYHDQDNWSRMAILNMAGMGMFSSDRSIQEYASKIWQAKPVNQNGIGNHNGEK